MLRLVHLCQKLFEHVQRMSGKDSDLKISLELFIGFFRSVRGRNHFIRGWHEVHEVFWWRIQLSRKLANTRV